MAELEKVIRGLECCGGISSAYKCPYQGSEGCDNCRGNIYLDALSLLKAQEPVRVGKKIKAGDVVLDFYSCGHCKNAIRKPWRYCPFCGQAVKWE